MAERTFYDLLEVSNSASLETIAAAYARLAEKLDPAKGGIAGDAVMRLQFDAIKQAYTTLSNADSRAQYDRKLQLRSLTPAPAQVVEHFWTLPKMLVAGLMLVAIAGFYFKHQKDQARLEAEKVIAVAKAKEAEAKARAEAETERLAMQRESEQARNERLEATRLRRERDADVRQFQREARVNEFGNRMNSTIDRAQGQNDDYRKRAEEARIKREEMQATAAANQQLARDRSELCRIERERYGRALSC